MLCIYIAFFIIYIAFFIYNNSTNWLQGIESRVTVLNINILVCFFLQNEQIFIQLDELDELNTITHAWIGFKYSLTQAQKTF